MGNYTCCIQTPTGMGIGWYAGIFRKYETVRCHWHGIFMFILDFRPEFSKTCQKSADRWSKIWWWAIINWQCWTCWESRIHPGACLGAWQERSPSAPPAENINQSAGNAPSISLICVFYCDKSNWMLDRCAFCPYFAYELQTFRLMVRPHPWHIKLHLGRSWKLCGPTNPSEKNYDFGRTSHLLVGHTAMCLVSLESCLKF